MSFAENLVFLRKQKEITQEQLAEQLEVSRQSVSKWESGQSYPEMEKLLQICSMFHCNMDTMMQGDIRKTFSEDIYGYDRQKNQFARWISIAVGLILLGISAMMFLTGAGWDENYASTVFFAFLIVGVLIMVVMGMQMNHFTQKHPVIEDFYTEEEKEHAYRKFTVRIAMGVGIILIGLLLVLAGDAFLERGLKESLIWQEAADQKEAVLNGILMLMLSAAVPILTYAGLQKAKYDIEGYNKEGNPSPERKKRNALIGKVCGCIMLLTVCVYLIWSVSTMAWGITWIVYPIGGILCGIASLVLSGGEK
ncbi:MAG: helix-turn-helix domain-containing protein [Lachnospiraceae bacterium]|nr:helix-turn-helix domain-containing protein [Lachnospiraceae bacterium]